MKVLVNYILQYLNFEEYDANHASNSQQTLYLDAFVAIFDSIRKDILLNLIIYYLQQNYILTKRKCQWTTSEVINIGKWKCGDNVEVPRISLPPKQALRAVC